MFIECVQTLSGTSIPYFHSFITRTWNIKLKKNSQSYNNNSCFVFHKFNVIVLHYGNLKLLHSDEHEILHEYSIVTLRRNVHYLVKRQHLTPRSHGLKEYLQDLHADWFGETEINSKTRGKKLSFKS